MFAPVAIDLSPGSSACYDITAAFPAGIVLMLPVTICHFDLYVAIIHYRLASDISVYSDIIYEYN